MLKKFVLIFIAFIFITSNLLAGFIVTPMEVHSTLKEDGKKTYSFWIKNNGSDDLYAKVYVSDFVLQPKGTEVFEEPGTLKRSCSNWISLERNILRLKPNEERNFKFKIAVPRDNLDESYNGVYWSMIFVEQTKSPELMKSEQKGRVYSIAAFQRIGVRVFATIRNTDNINASVDSLNVKTIENKKTKEKKLQVDLKVKNTGNIILNCKGDLEITDDQGREIKKQEIEKFRCYPDSSRHIRLFLDPLDKGFYSFLSIIDYGAEELIAGETVLEIP